MNFEEAHAVWMQSHLERRSGERKGRLERGHRHGEKLFLRNVWWPLRGNLDDLHPEYEISDWRGRPYFADLAWLPGSSKILLEIKGYGPHVRDMDRQKYCEELNRELFMQGLGFKVLSFAYDDVADRPDLCMALLRVVLSRHQPGQPAVDLRTRTEREIILLAIQLARFIRPKDIEQHMALNHRTAVRYLQSLTQKGWLRPIPCSKGQKILKYELVKSHLDDLDWL